MASLYKRKKMWWFQVQVDGHRIRESTSMKNKYDAEVVMNRRVKELRGLVKPKIVLPKLLILDIETSPIEGYTWTFWPNFIDPMSQVIKNSKGKPKDWAILTWAAKWLFSDKVYSAKVKHSEAIEHEDKSVMKKLWKLYEEADVIIAQNGVRFDIRRCAWRFKVNGFGPTSPFQVIDTLKVAKKAFGIPSYKQDYMNRELGLTRKIDTDFELWERCVNGDKKAINEMLAYNKGDIQGLEDLYLELRPWIRGPVNLSMYGENERKQCHNCLSPDLKALAKPYTTPAGQYEAYRCLKCGAIGRDRYTLKTLRQRRNSILPTAR